MAGSKFHRLRPDTGRGYCSGSHGRPDSIGSSRGPRPNDYFRYRGLADDLHSSRLDRGHAGGEEIRRTSPWRALRSLGFLRLLSWCGVWARYSDRILTSDPSAGHTSCTGSGVRPGGGYRTFGLYKLRLLLWQAVVPVFRIGSETGWVLGVRLFGQKKKIAYESGFDGVPVVPVQAMTAVVNTSAGLVGMLLFLHSYYSAALILSLVVTHLWRVWSETLRADYRGGERFPRIRSWRG